MESIILENRRIANAYCAITETETTQSNQNFNFNHTLNGALIGAGVGAATVLISKKKGSVLKNALGGAALGGIAGTAMSFGGNGVSIPYSEESPSLADNINTGSSSTISSIKKSHSLSDAFPSIDTLKNSKSSNQQSPTYTTKTNINQRRCKTVSFPKFKNAQSTEIVRKGNPYASADSSATEKYLRSYYGDNTDDVVQSALKARFGGNKVPSKANTFNTSTNFNGKVDYNPEISDPLARIKDTNGRSRTMRYSDGGTEVFINKNGWGGWSYGDGCEGHEIGHALNKMSIGNPNRGDELLDPNLGFYHTANDSELATTLGTLRRNVFRFTNGTVDTANPDTLKEVMLNPTKYGASKYDTQAVGDIQNLLDYQGDNPKLLQRQQEIRTRIEDPEFLKQFVSNGSRKSKMASMA